MKSLHSSKHPVYDTLSQIYPAYMLTDIPVKAITRQVQMSLHPPTVCFNIPKLNLFSLAVHIL